jgi:integrase
LDGLSKRDRATGPDSLVFTMRGAHIDPSTIRARYVRARDAAIKADAEIPRLRFHDLRHTFGTLAVSEGVDVLAVKEWMGHRDVATTMGYLHYAERSTDADRLSQAFAGKSAEAMAGEERPAIAA